VRRLLIASASFLLLAGGLLFPVVTSRAARVDAGTGYELENVEVMDRTMRLADARRYMIAFNDALGVQCRDCHNPRDFPSDEKQLKVAARAMMKMQREINSRWFADEATPRVTCWTCHQGKLHPSLPPDPDRETAPGEEPGAGNGANEPGDGTGTGSGEN
jgi:Photosynthetic reaction centre cytochrome C subunit